MVKGQKDFKGESIDLDKPTGERIHGVVAIPERQRAFRESLSNVPCKKLKEGSTSETVLGAERVNPAACEGIS